MLADLAKPAPSGSARFRAVIADAARRCVPSLPLLVGLVALLRSLVDRRALLNDPDTYLHIAAGRWMLAHGALPAADPFSHTMAGAHWAAPEWLAEIVLAAFYNTGGWSAIVVLAAASFAASLAILTRYLLRHFDPLPCAVAAIAAMALVLPHLVARPHILALPPLVLWSASLFAARDAGRAPPLWLLAVMPLWANLHGSFLFGLALAGFLAAEAVLWPASGHSRAAEARRWGLFVIVAIAAAMVTPSGVAGLVQPFRLMAMPALYSSFSEWLPPDLAHTPELELWLLGALALGFLSGMRLPLSRLVLLLALFHMALHATRHADLLGLVGPLVVAGSLGPALAARLRPAASSALTRGLARLAAPARAPAIAIALGLALAIAWPTLAGPLARGDDAVTPASALAAAQRLGLSGRVFNAERFGGYLVFAGVPTFIDGRIEMYGNDFLAREVAAEYGDVATLATLLDQYRIDWTLLPPQSGAAKALDHMPGWRRLYADDYAVIDGRVDSAPN